MDKLSDAQKRAKILALLKAKQQQIQYFPLSYSQQRLWFLDQMQPLSAVYNIALAVELYGELDLALLQQAFDHIVQRHAMLRACLETNDGKPRQRIKPKLSIPIQVKDCSDNDFDQFLASLAYQPFDLEKDSLIRFYCINTDADFKVLLWVVHHIIADGWSMGILQQELAYFYQTLQQGKTPNLPLPKIQYTDFIAWQQQRWQSSWLEQELKFWQSYLAGIEVLELATDLSRPAIQTDHGNTYYFHLSKTVVSQFETLLQAEQATLFMGLMTVWQVLLFHYSRQSNFAVGTPFHGRERQETKDVIGFFVNTLVIPSHINPKNTFLQQLAVTKKHLLSAFNHPDLPFEYLVDALKVERQPSHTPLFQVLFAWQNLPMATTQLESIPFKRHDILGKTAKFDLSLVIVPESEDYSASLEYNSDLFLATTIEAMASHYQQLLVEIIRQAQTKIGDLRLLNQSQQAQLKALGYRQGEYPHSSLSHLISQWANVQPEKTAIVSDQTQLTYQQLEQFSNQLARYLQTIGVQANDRVGVQLNPCCELVVIVLAILKLGASYLPLDPNYPESRLQMMREDAQIRVLFAESDLDLAMPVIIWQQHQSQILSQSSQPFAIDVPPLTAAYLIYTSGSTGRPKGVIGHHLGVVNLLADLQQRLPLVPSDNGSWWSSFSFDVAVYELFSILVAGGCLYIPPDKHRSDPAQLFAWLLQHQISAAYLPPFFLAPLLTWLQQEGHANAMKLRRLLVGVEPIAETLLAEIQQRIPDLQIINGYGPTEASICCSLYSVPKARKYQRRTPIGEVVQNNQILILNAQRQFVPKGVVGELYVGGLGLTHGYWQRPELDSLWVTLYDQRFYRTGDLVRFLADGPLQFIGRVDHQVKLRGYRIELGEIEALLLQQEDIADAVVMVQTLQDRPHLIAYLVLAHNDFNLESLKQELKQQLPDYMVPAYFMVLETLPTTDNGKLDRKALPLPMPVTTTDYFPPQSPIEQLLVNIWQQVLGVAKVSITDNFFSLGGDSIISIEVIAKARAHGVMIEPKQLFQYQTIVE